MGVEKNVKQRIVAALFAVTIFISAFLLFQIQPLISKAILPWFGGTPNVWTSCLLFFQSVLFGGYLYAHLLTDYLSRKWQVAVHIGLLCTAVWLLQILPDFSAGQPLTASPVVSIILLLSATVGLPYFVLSTHGPLLQAWFAYALPGTSPYRLYALSNVGSLLALLSYPFVFEPKIGTVELAAFWSAGFILLAVLSALCGLVAGTSSDVAEHSSGLRPVPGVSAPIGDGNTGSRSLLWFALAMTASVLLLAMTNQVCQDVAVIPFLWVVPLALYLLSFVLCFDSERWYSRKGYSVAGMASVIVVTLLLVVPQLFGSMIALQLALYFTALFVLCMLCHGELARLKPAPEKLTAFYLVMAAGGATGGILVGVVAPMFFPLFLEMHLVLVVCAVLAFFVYRRARAPGLTLWGNTLVARLVAKVCMVAVPVLLSWHFLAHTWGVVDIERNFYGVIRVVEKKAGEDSEQAVTQLIHGRISHGQQLQDQKLAMVPTSYYGETSGVGRLVDAMRRRDPQLKVGVVGLGVGTLAAYGRDGDLYRFYEINDAVKSMAQRYFSFLDGTRAMVELVPGDARMTLAGESDQHYDLLVLDAFSGDAVPAHLLTREAAAVYSRQLVAGGVLAIHISNTYLDLEPVAAALAEDMGLAFRVIRSAGDRDPAGLPSSWLLASGNAAIFEDPALEAVAWHDAGRRVLWTDNFSNLYSVLRH